MHNRSGNEKNINMKAKNRKNEWKKKREERKEQTAARETEELISPEEKLEQRKQRLMQIFRHKDYVPMRIRELAILLDVPKEERADLILEQAARPLIPFMLLIAAYMLLHSETTPGGGFSGGTLLGAGLILTSAAFGAESAQRLLSRRQYSAVRTFGLLAYGLLYGAYIFIGANGLQNHLTRLFLLLDLAVGLVVACTIYGFYALFSRGRI